MFRSVLNLLIPNRCICGQILLDENSHICQKCWADIGYIGASSVCETCGIPFEFQMAAGTLCPDCIEHTPNFDKARSVFKYNDISGQMITGLKFQDKTPYAKTLANLMSPRLSEFDGDFDIITSVPLHPLKLIKRKYNQAAVLANKLARLNNKKANNLILKKVRNIKPQTSLTRKERIENVRGAIEINKKYISDIKGKNILLVDDVMTTGATANECAKMLKGAGADRVYLLTAARTIIEK